MYYKILYDLVDVDSSCFLNAQCIFIHSNFDIDLFLVCLLLDIEDCLVPLQLQSF